MTPAPDNLEELRLLREARLPSGFEERLRERLHAVAGEGKVVRLSPRRRYHGLLLFAAIALPIAALAAGGVLIARQFSEPKEHARPTVTANRASTPTVAASNVETVEGEAAAPAKRERSLAPKGVAPSRSNGVKRKVEATKATTNVSIPENVERAPATIESFDLEVPKRSSSGVASDTVKRSALRSATAHGNAKPVSAELESTTENRKQSAERRGSDAAQQAKERVQARERKGQ